MALLPAANAFVNLHVVRNHLNSSIPITILFWGPKEELSAPTQQLFKVRRSLLGESRGSWRLAAGILSVEAVIRTKGNGERRVGLCFRPSSERTIELAPLSLCFQAPAVGRRAFLHTSLCLACPVHQAQEHISDIQLVDVSTLPYPKHMRRLFLPELNEPFNGWAILYYSRCSSVTDLVSHPWKTGRVGASTPSLCMRVLQ